MYRFHPQWFRARELASDGTIGEIRTIHTAFGYMNQNPDNIRNISEYGGGAMYDIGCYAVSVARFMYGAEPSRVVGQITRDARFGTDVLASGIMEFGNGHATFTVGTLMYPHQTVTVIGTEGCLTVKIPFNAPSDTASDVELTTGDGTRTLPCGPADQYRLEFAAFSEAVRDSGSVPTPIDDAVANMQVIDAIFRSEQNGGWETV